MAAAKPRLVRQEPPSALAWGSSPPRCSSEGRWEPRELRQLLPLCSETTDGQGLYVGPKIAPLRSVRCGSPARLVRAISAGHRAPGDVGRVVDAAQASRTALRARIVVADGRAFRVERTIRIAVRRPLGVRIRVADCGAGEREAERDDRKRNSHVQSPFEGLSK